jgi:hypothetical protein
MILYFTRVVGTGLQLYFYINQLSQSVQYNKSVLKLLNLRRALLCHDKFLWNTFQNSSIKLAAFSLLFL